MCRITLEWPCNLFPFKFLFLKRKSKTEKVTLIAYQYEYTVLYKLLISISEHKILTYLVKKKEY